MLHVVQFYLGQEMPVAGYNILVRKIDFKNCVKALTIYAFCGHGNQPSGLK